MEGDCSTTGGLSWIWVVSNTSLYRISEAFYWVLCLFHGILHDGWTFYLDGLRVFLNSHRFQNMRFLFGVSFLFHYELRKKFHVAMGCLFFLFLQYAGLFKFAFNIYSIIRNVLYFSKTNFTSDKIIKFDFLFLFAIEGKIKKKKSLN